MAHAFHPVRDYLQKLKWDGIERLDHWLADFLGAKDREYVRLVSRWWLMGAVKRVLQPGCKFDYCLVLEGEQGKKKSSAFSVIGGEWFGDTDLDFANKDSMIALSGKLVYELAELGALARTDERRQKSFLSRRFDEFRPPYGRTYIKSPRQLVFGGSTNEWEWNKDPTGGRRFWPLECGDINIDGLIAARDQLFAEAHHRVLEGEKYWPTAEEQKTLFDPEQLRVEQPDGFIDVLHDWVNKQVMEFSLAKAIMDGLDLDASKMTRDIQTRVGTALRKLGCERVERRNGAVRFLYKPPVRNEAASTSQPAQQTMEDNYEPF
jgi:predicted P-loop ATPase